MTVTTEKIRTAIEDKGVDLRIVATRMELWKREGQKCHPDIGALKRYLGITFTVQHDGSRSKRLRMRESTAVRILEAADIDPWEVDL